jgi:hypothetical protein
MRLIQPVLPGIIKSSLENITLDDAAMNVIHPINPVRSRERATDSTPFA